MQPEEPTTPEQNNTPTTPAQRGSIKPLNEDALREHLASTQSIPPSVPQPVQTPPEQPIAVPLRTEPVSPATEVEWKPTTSLARRSGMLRFYAWAIIISMGTIMGFSLLMLPALVQGAVSPLLVGILFGAYIVLFLAGILLLTTKSKKLVTTLLFIIMGLNAVSIVLAALTLNLTTILSGVVFLALAFAVYRDTRPLA